MTDDGRRSLRLGLIAWAMCVGPRLGAVCAVWPAVRLATESAVLDGGRLSTDIHLASVPPGYAVFAELLGRLVGAQPLPYVLGHVAVQSLVGPFVLSLCRSLALPPRSAWLAVAACACLPYYVAASVRQIDVGVLVAVSAGFVAAAAAWRASGVGAPVRVAGVALAAMALFLTRANALSLIAGIYAVLWWSPGRLPRRAIAASAACMLALLLGWSAANAWRFGAFTPWPANAGLNLWIGNRPGVSRDLDDRAFSPPIGVPDLPTTATTVYGADQEAFRAAWQYIFDHPAESVGNAGRKFLRYWDWRLDDRSPHALWEHGFYTGPFLLMLAGAVPGLVVLWRRHRFALAVLAATIVGYQLPHLLTFGCIRFRMSVEWAALIVASVGVDALVRMASPAYSLRRDE